MSEAPEAKMGLSKVWEHRLEVASAFLLGIAAVATSWGTYQSALWGGDQARKYSRANGIRAEAVRASTGTGQLMTVDLGMFVQWLNADLAGDVERAKYYRTHFRPEFAPAFEAWIAKHSTMEPNVESTPFFMSEYKLSMKEEAKRLEGLADQTFKEGEQANKISDGYVLVTVMLSAVLFFAGIAQQFSHFSSRAAVLGIAALLCIWSIVRMATMPVN